MVLTLGALTPWKLLDPRRYVPYSRNRERIFQALDPRHDGILEKVDSASLISALALSRDDTESLSLLRASYNRGNSESGRPSSPTGTFLYTCRREKYKEKDRIGKEIREREREGQRGIPGACRRAVLLPNYSKHSAIGASIKEASSLYFFRHLPHILASSFFFLFSFPLRRPSAVS